MPDQATDREALRQALAVVLARVRCKVLHNQTNGGRCAACISWAEHVGVPEHLSRIEQAITDARAEGQRDPAPGHMHEIDRSLYELAVKERDYERVRNDSAFERGRAEGVRQAKAAVEALYGGEPPPVFIKGTKIVRATAYNRDLRCDITESFLRVDDVRAAISDLGDDQ